MEKLEMHFCQKANFACVSKIKRIQKLWHANSMIKNIVINFFLEFCSSFYIYKFEFCGVSFLINQFDYKCSIYDLPCRQAVDTMTRNDKY